MPEPVTEGTTTYLRYKPSELIAAWAGPGQGHEQAKSLYEHPWNVVEPDVDFLKALLLTRLFVLRFALPTCVYYNRDTKTISFHCGQAGHQDCGTLKRDIESMLRGYRGIMIPEDLITEEMLEKL